MVSPTGATSGRGRSTPLAYHKTSANRSIFNKGFIVRTDTNYHLTLRNVSSNDRFAQCGIGPIDIMLKQTDRLGVRGWIGETAPLSTSYAECPHTPEDF